MEQKQNCDAGKSMQPIGLMTCEPTNKAPRLRM